MTGLLSLKDIFMKILNSIEVKIVSGASVPVNYYSAVARVVVAWRNFKHRY